MKEKGFIDAGILAAIALGGGLSLRGRPYQVCEICRNSILTGQGYRFVPQFGNVHGACLAERERAKGEGKDAEQGQARPGGDSGGVCPPG